MATCAVGALLRPHCRRLSRRAEGVSAKRNFACRARFSRIRVYVRPRRRLRLVLCWKVGLDPSAMISTQAPRDFLRNAAHDNTRAQTWYGARLFHRNDSAAFLPIAESIRRPNSIVFASLTSTRLSIARPSYFDDASCVASAPPSRFSPAPPGWVLSLPFIMCVRRRAHRLHQHVQDPPQQLLTLGVEPVEVPDQNQIRRLKGRAWARQTVIAVLRITVQQPRRQASPRE